MRPIQLAPLVLLIACADDAGSAPTISALTYTPSAVTANQQSTITGSITFADADGDLAQLGVDVVMPDLTETSLPMTDLQGVGEMTSGTLAFQMILVPPTAGTYRFALFLTDDGDNESNRLEGTLTAQ